MSSLYKVYDLKAFKLELAFYIMQVSFPETTSAIYIKHWTEIELRTEQ
jgi:hypothetical protein